MKTNTDTNSQLINQYLEMVATDAYDRFGDIITDDCVFEFMPIGHAFRGREEVMNFVLALGSSRKHDKRSKVDITNWFTNGEYFCIEYEHGFILNALHRRIKFDGYCIVFHIRNGKFDAVREYLNPSSAGISFITTFVLRMLPLLVKIKTRQRTRKQAKRQR